MQSEDSSDDKQIESAPGFLRKVMLLSGATAVGQLLNFLAAPVVTRLFTPADFGVAGTFAALVGLFQVVASARYENAIPLPHSRGEGLRLVSLCVAILTVLCFFSLAVIGLWGGTLWLPTRLEGLRSHLILLPFGFLGLGLFTIAEFWAIRQSYFGELSKTKIWQGLASLSVQLAAGFRHAGARGLIIAFVVGQSAGGLRLWKLLWRDFRSEPKFSLELGPAAELARRFRNFPLVTTWAALAKISGQYFPLLFFSIYYGQDATGWLALAQRILALPLILVGEAVSRAYLSAAAKLRGQRSNKAQQQLFWKVVKGQILLGVFVLLPGLLAAPWAFEFFFGKVWREAGIYALCSGVGLFGQLVVAPVHCQLDVAERQRLSLLGEVVRWIFLLMAAGWALHYQVSPSRCAFLLGLAGGSAMAFILFLCWWSFKADSSVAPAAESIVSEV